METKYIKRIKKSVTEKEYKKLMAFVRGDEDYNEPLKQN